MKAVYVNEEFNNLKDIINHKLDVAKSKHKELQVLFEDEIDDYNKKSCVYKFFNHHPRHIFGYSKYIDELSIAASLVYKIQNILFKLNFAITTNASVIHFEDKELKLLK